MLNRRASFFRASGLLSAPSRFGQSPRCSGTLFASADKLVILQAYRSASSRSGPPNRRPRRVRATKRLTQGEAEPAGVESLTADIPKTEGTTRKKDHDSGTPPIVVYPQTLVPSSVLEMISTPQQGAPANEAPSSLQLNAIFIWPKGVRKLLVDDVRIKKQKLLQAAQHAEDEAKEVEPVETSSHADQPRKE